MMRDGDPIVCTGCGTPTGSHWPETPVPCRCEKCPPEKCDTCGQMDSVGNRCPCWVPLEGMAHADIKALFAEIGLGLSPPTDGK